MLDSEISLLIGIHRVIDAIIICYGSKTLNLKNNSLDFAETLAVTNLSKLDINWGLLIMNQTKLVFIILHYKNINDTLECIKSIEFLNLLNSKIVVVENGSMDTSTDELKKLTESIDIVFNDNNYGFAKGNNTGIYFAKDKYNPEYYAVINNDILIDDENILDVIKEVYNVYEFDVLGPKIIARDGINQNPNYLVLTKSKSIIKHLIRLYIISILNMIGMYKYFKKKHKNKNLIKKMEIDNMILEGTPLHGSALIFSKKYIERYKKPFNEDTFLYGEEEFLYYRKIRDKLKFIYSPNITVYHKEDSSLNNVFNDNNEEKIKFVTRHSRKSLLKLISLKIANKMGGRIDE